ncbi:MAG TPA: helix-turn-helix transcriptional regulator, partial [Pseudolabrys sp.]|nr:helix-turn-helix transcriptional regulator [Pseudolabrys sp.]
MKNRSGAGEDAAISGADEVPAPSRAIRDVRLSQGLSLRALSARAGLPYSTLSKLENGKMTLTYDKLIRL